MTHVQRIFGYGVVFPVFFHFFFGMPTSVRAAGFEKELLVPAIEKIKLYEQLRMPSGYVIRSSINASKGEKRTRRMEAYFVRDASNESHRILTTHPAIKLNVYVRNSEYSFVVRKSLKRDGEIPDISGDVGSDSLFFLETHSRPPSERAGFLYTTLPPQYYNENLSIRKLFALWSDREVDAVYNSRTESGWHRFELPGWPASGIEVFTISVDENANIREFKEKYTNGRETMTVIAEPIEVDSVFIIPNVTITTTKDDEPGIVYTTELSSSIEKLNETPPKEWFAIGHYGLELPGPVVAQRPKDGLSLTIIAGLIITSVVIIILWRRKLLLVSR